MLNSKTALSARVLALMLALGVVFGAPLHQMVSGQAVHNVYLPLITNGPFRIHLPIIMVPLPPEPEPEPPAYTTSWYISSMSTTQAYQQGCAAGQRDAALDGTQDSLIILDFGQQWYETSQWGVWHFGGYFSNNAQVGWVVKEFAHGYWVCTGTDRTSHLTLGIGTSNYGRYADAATNDELRREYALQAGQAWAQLTEEVSNWVVTNGYSGQVTISAAIDVEWDNQTAYGWNSPYVTRAWVDAFDARDQGKYVYYNYGACAGCPTRLNTYPGMGDGWTLADIYYVSYGVPPAFTVPEIYANNGVHARQWAYLSYYWASQGYPKIIYPGVMTQMQACLQFPSGCEDLDNTPAQAFDQMMAELAIWPITRQDNIPWLTDIQWAQPYTPGSATLAEGIGGQEAVLQALQDDLNDMQGFNAESWLQAKLQMLEALRAERNLGSLYAPEKPLDVQAAAPADDKAVPERGPGGLGDERRPPLSAQMAQVSNHWAGDVNGTWTVVYGGVLPGDDSQGLAVWQQVDSGQLRVLQPSTASGALRVISAQDGRVTLQDETGALWLLDASTGQWLTAGQ